MAGPRVSGKGKGKIADQQNPAETNEQTRYLTYAQFFQNMSDKYGNVSAAGVQSAMMRALPFQSVYTANPLIQNQRVKQVSSLPVDKTKNDIVEMLLHPDSNEQGIRQVSNILEYTAYPMLKIRTTYQDLLTYRHYVYPEYLTDEQAASQEFAREWQTVCRFEKSFECERNARKIVGQCVRDGKVFYVPRVDVDKSHSNVRYSFMQQLPQDWVKITGFNNISKYTVAFNMFYFLQPGTTYKQFGDLFEPYMQEFEGVIGGSVKKGPKGVIFASKNNVDVAKARALMERVGNGEASQNIEIYQQNGTWFYWVYLPPEKVWTFEIDDVKTNVVPNTTGLFLSMAQIAQYEQVQLEIVQNPLVSMVLGTIETYDSTATREADPIKISPAGRELFQSMFYQMLAQTNTGGVGIYSAPFKDMKLVQLAEAPNATNISSSGYEYAMEKSGLSALIPTTSDARAGVAQISLKIESRYAEHIYWQFEKMMNYLLASQNFKYTWRFKMFGDLATDEALIKQMEKSMTLGILPDVFMYNALMDRTVLDDLSMSRAIKKCKLLDLRLPLISSYSGKSANPNLPPTDNEAGRPKSDNVTSEGMEQDADDATGANEL